MDRECFIYTGFIPAIGNSKNTRDTKRSNGAGGCLNFFSLLKKITENSVTDAIFKYGYTNFILTYVLR